jgi:hypothetical protein
MQVSTAEARMPIKKNPSSSPFCAIKPKVAMQWNFSVKPATQQLHHLFMLLSRTGARMPTEKNLPPFIARILPRKPGRVASQAG